MRCEGKEEQYIPKRFQFQFFGGEDSKDFPPKRNRDEDDKLHPIGGHDKGGEKRRW